MYLGMGGNEDFIHVHEYPASNEIREYLRPHLQCINVQA